MYGELCIDQIATFVYAVVDSRSSSLVFANAGHLPPGRQCQRRRTAGRPARTAPRCEPVRLRHGDAPLEPGSMPVLDTDGLVESRGGDTDERIDRATEIARRWTGEIDGLPTALVSEFWPLGDPPTTSPSSSPACGRWRTSQPHRRRPEPE